MCDDLVLDLLLLEAFAPRPVLVYVPSQDTRFSCDYCSARCLSPPFYSDGNIVDACDECWRAAKVPADAGTFYKVVGLNGSDRFGRELDTTPCRPRAYERRRQQEEQSRRQEEQNRRQLEQRRRQQEEQMRRQQEATRLEEDGRLSLALARSMADFGPPRGPRVAPASGTELADGIHIRVPHEELGRGAFGVVLRGSVRGTAAAIKLFNASGPLSPGQERIVARELEMAGRLRVDETPYLVRYLATGIANGVPFVAMDLCPGTLMGLIRRFNAAGEYNGRPSSVALREQLRVLVQVAKGMAALHERDIAHRDLKPQNVLVTALDHVQICDLGLAKAFDVLATASTARVVGTPRYIAPEIHTASGVRTEDFWRKADVFAFGILAAEVLTGSIGDLEGLSMDELRRAYASGRRPALPGHAPRDPLLAAMAGDPRRRPTFAQLVTDLSDALDAAGGRERECLACQCAPATVRLLPCRHVVFCAPCARRAREAGNCCVYRCDWTSSETAHPRELHQSGL